MPLDIVLTLFIINTNFNKLEILGCFIDADPRSMQLFLALKFYRGPFHHALRLFITNCIVAQISTIEANTDFKIIQAPSLNMHKRFSNFSEIDSFTHRTYGELITQCNSAGFKSSFTAYLQCRLVECRWIRRNDAMIVPWASYQIR